jgi:hypothetical protein
MLTVQTIDAAAAAIEDEEGVPSQERGEFSNAVAHAYNLAVETDPGVRRRLEDDRDLMNPLMRKWFDKLVERAAAQASS